MNFAFNDEQELLRATARRYLDTTVPSATVRSLMETEAGYDPAQWSDLARMGWQSMAIPEQYGGAGYTFLETAVLLEEMGRSLFPAPFLSTVVMAPDLLRAGSEDQQRELLTGIAAGERLVAVAWAEPSGRWDAAGVQTEARPAGGDWILSGTKSFVIDGHVADTLIVAARTGQGDRPEEGITLFLLPADTVGVECRRLETMDPTRKLAEVQLHEVRLPPAAQLGEIGAAWPALSDLRDLVSVALAVEGVGGAQRCLDLAVDYAKVRVQFGRPIGSFQAVKHKCADMLVAVESAKSAAYYAAWAASEGGRELATVAPLAKSYCADAFFAVAEETIQVLGGIGFTWEHDAHLFFKRAKTNQLLFGDPAFQRRLLADRLGL